MYKLSGSVDDTHYDTDEIRTAFHGKEALQVTEVCARVLGEQNLYNIALGDMVHIAHILQWDKGFKTVSITTAKDFKLGTYAQFAPSVDVNKLHNIPSNYATFSWRLKDKRRTIAPYFHLDAEKHSVNQIIESIIDRFEHCSTAIVAEELLYLYKDGEDPSAYFVAKVFMYLSQMDSLEIESRSEIVTSIENVDDIKYQEIDKSGIKFAEPTGRMASMQQQAKAAALSKTIEEMDFNVRTYNSLRRAGIKTAEDLTKKTRLDLSKVRNLGQRGQTEVVEKLKGLGLFLKDDDV